MTSQADQLLMFTEGEDLPLFSGTPQRAHVATFTPEPAIHQAILAQCSVCLDTGRVNGNLCWCEAGNRIRDEFLCKGAK